MLPPARLAPGQVQTLGHTGPAGRRHYLLRLPATRRDFYAGVVVLLHGGHQTAADFAAGAAMESQADAHGWLLVYPQQSRGANPQRFWNWFAPEHQQAGSGEPAILAGLVRDVVESFDVDPTAVYLAGFSAGGAMAAVLAATHPQLFAAVAVHSGLPYRSARDVFSAWQAMQHGGIPVPPAPVGQAPLLVLQGDADTTVNPVNARHLVQARLSGMSGTVAETTAVPPTSTMRGYARTVHRDRFGTTAAELLLVHGAGHQWFGGTRGAGFTDPKAPSAPAELARFFTARPPR